MGQMEWGSIAQWASPIVTLFVAVWAVKRAGNKEAIDSLKDEIGKLRDEDGRLFDRVDKVESRVATVETEIKHLPTKEEMHRIDTKITEIGARIEARFGALADKIDLVIQQNERAQDRLAEREDRAR